jgi:phage protein U
MLAKLNDFLFELSKTDLESIQHQISFKWNRQDRAGNHQHTQKAGKWEESITFSGKLIMQSTNALKDFEDIAKEQKPVRLTLGTGESYLVTIDSLSRMKSGFLKDGKYRYQEFSIPMQRYFK